jgi:hypothetical protein
MEEERPMLNISTKTKLTPEEAVNKVVKYFGPNGYKLKVVQLTETMAYLEGGGGSVSVTATREDNKTSLEFISVEWDYQVKEFIKSIH